MSSSDPKQNPATDPGNSQVEKLTDVAVPLSG